MQGSAKFIGSNFTISISIHAEAIRISHILKYSMAYQMSKTSKTEVQGFYVDRIMVQSPWYFCDIVKIYL